MDGLQSYLIRSALEKVQTLALAVMMLSVSENECETSSIPTVNMQNAGSAEVPLCYLPSAAQKVNLAPKAPAISS